MLNPYPCPDPASNTDYPRAVIYDFVCTPPEEYGKDFDDGLHTTVVEFPANTFVGESVII